MIKCRTEKNAKKWGANHMIIKIIKIKKRETGYRKTSKIKRVYWLLNYDSNNIAEKYCDLNKKADKQLNSDLIHITPLKHWKFSIHIRTNKKKQTTLYCIL